MLNLTPHKISIMGKDGKMIDFLPAGKVVRVLYKNTVIDNPYLPVETVTNLFQLMEYRQQILIIRF